MNRTESEKRVLENLEEGKYDGTVGNNVITMKGTIITAVEKGVPKRSLMDLNGDMHVIKVWQTDKEKLEFVEKCGYLFWDRDIRYFLRSLRKT